MVIVVYIYIYIFISSYSCGAKTTYIPQVFSPQEKKTESPMDSFEWRRIISKKLESLPPSRQAAQECAKLILRNEEFLEDLHSVILETLDTVDLNFRINIFQVIEELLEICTLENIVSYKTTILNDLPLILSKLLPKSPFHDNNAISTTGFKGLTNLHSTHLIMCEIFKDSPDLESYRKKFYSNLLTEEDMHNLELSLPFNEDPIYETINKRFENLQESIDNAWGFLISKKRQSQYERNLIEKAIFLNTKGEDNDQAMGEVAEQKQDDNEDGHQQQGEEVAEEEEAEAMSVQPEVEVEDEAEVEVEAEAEPEIITIDLTTPSVRESTKSPEKSTDTKPVDETPMRNVDTDGMSSKNQRQLILSHRRMLLRIEADRERQKKSKENLWTVNRQKSQGNNTNTGLIKFDREEFEDIYNKFDSFDYYEDGRINEEMNKLIYNSLNDFRKYNPPYRVNSTPSTPSTNTNKNTNNNNNNNNGIPTNPHAYKRQKTHSS